MNPVLYERATSSCSFRIRIALNLADVEYEHSFVSATAGREAKFQSLNPQGLVPLLVFGHTRLSQSMAIFEYLVEEVPSGKNLLPKDADGRARVRSIAQFIICEIQPLQNTRIDQSLTDQGVDKLAWKQHWIHTGLDNVEAMLTSELTGRFCHGDEPTIADCCLVPQVYNAVNMYKLSTSQYPNISKIYQEATQHPAFEKAWPDRQEDFGKPA